MELQNRISIITGHYGSGKTNVAVNLALYLARHSGGPVTVVDLDIVNPYFRTADFRGRMEAAGIRVIAPVYANTNLDSPVLPPEINAVFRPESGWVIIDVGGDDAGAIALGQYAARMEASGYSLYYVVNNRRYLTQSPAEAISLLREIEAVSRLRATGIINNTNLGRDTTLELVRDSLPYAREVSRLAGLPLAFTSVWEELPGADAIPGALPVKLLVKQAWE